jgi:DNA-binding winged helix-turn-helix (wHTH) protein
MIYRLGSGLEWELDEDLWQLRRRGQRVPVQPKVLALLFYLARSRDRVVSADELLRELWPDEVVTASSLGRAISLARATLGDRGSREPLIQTVTRRGYRLRATDARGPVSAQREGALIGRERAFQSLHEDLAAVRDGKGRVRILRGEAGIGKTRLADEISTQAQAFGALVCRAFCVPESGQPALWPWIRVARTLLDARPVIEPRKRARVQSLRALIDAGDPATPAAQGHLKDHAPAPRSDLHAGAGIFEVVDGLASVLEGAAAALPVVIVLDDIQWADVDSLRVLELLAREIKNSRVYLLAALRDDEPTTGGALRACLGVLERLLHADVLRLERLTRSETDALVRATWGPDPSDALLDYAWKAAAGNPLFATELVRHVRAKGAWDGDDSAKLADPPASLRALLDAKVARASVSARELLAASAVTGADVEIGLVRDALGITIEDANARLDELERLGLLEPGRDSERNWRFHHPLARELVLAGLSRADRTRYHARIAESLERSSGANPDAVSSELAGHYLALARAGGPSASAVVWSERAARIALRRCAYDESAQGFAAALEALRMDRSIDAREELRLLLALGEAHARANALDPAADAAEHAARIAREISDGAALARAALLVFVRGPESGGPFTRVVALLEEAEQRCRGESDSLRARVLARLSNELYFVAGTTGRRVALADEALVLAARADLETRIFVAYYASSGGWWRLRATDRAARMAELIALADELGDPSVRFLVSAPYIASQLECGRLDAVDNEIERMSRRVDSLSVPSYFAWYAPFYRAMRALYEGQFADAERLALLARDLGQRARTQDSERNFTGQLVTLRLEQGRPAEIEDLVRRIRQQPARTSIFRAGALRALSDDGQHDEARAGLDAWRREGIPDPLDDTSGVLSLMVLGGVCFAEGDADAAAEVARPLERYVGENATSTFGGVCLGPVDRVLGLLAITLGRHDEAITRLRDSERATERQGARPTLTRVRLGLAQALLARGKRGDVAAAREMATSAAGLAEALGMESIASRARSIAEGRGNGR